MEAKVYNNKGAEVEKVELPEVLFGQKWNADLVNQVVLSLRTAARRPYAHVKDRGEVSGGGKKPWKQKGTGRARHGSIRSPIWIGGGVSHGPNKNENFSRKVNQKMKNKALSAVLSAKFKDGEIIFLDKFGLDNIKTKKALQVLKALSSVSGYEKLSYKKGNRALIAIPKPDAKVVKSFRNIPSVNVLEARNLNPVEVLNYKYVLFSNPEESLNSLLSRFSVKSE